LARIIREQPGKRHLGGLGRDVSPSHCLKTQPNYHKMGLIPGSSTVEHSAVKKAVKIK
jgi:hypothetical protein